MWPVKGRVCTVHPPVSCAEVGLWLPQSLLPNTWLTKVRAILEKIQLLLFKSWGVETQVNWEAHRPEETKEMDSYTQDDILIKELEEKKTPLEKIRKSELNM